MNAPSLGVDAAPRVLIVESIGHRVPRSGFAGSVQTIFARACNFTGDDTLLTLCAHRASDGPTTLRLAAGTASDLRDLFTIGEPVSIRNGWMRTAHAELDLTRAHIWRPEKARRPTRRASIDAKLHRAGHCLARYRKARRSIIDHEAVPVIAALRDACARMSGEDARPHIRPLVGWGEGLTPAGDDYLVGLLAGLDALAGSDVERLRFQASLAAEVIAHSSRTTPIAAHYLRLAARGDYAATLIHLRDALLADDEDERVDTALAAAIAVGATSGADTVSGLLAGLAAWTSSKLLSP